MTFRVYISKDDFKVDHQGFLAHEGRKLACLPYPEMHPRGIKELVNKRRRLDASFATLHPYMLDYAKLEEIYYLDGRCLADHPDAERSRGILTPGEFWSSISDGKEW